MGGDGGGEGRPPLPGFSSSFDPLVMNKIYADICDAESKYLRERHEQPVRVTQEHGKHGRFHVVDHRSFTEVRPSKSMVGSVASSRSTASRTTGASRASRRSASAATAAAANLLAPRSPSAAGSRARSATGSKAPSRRTEGSTALSFAPSKSMSALQAIEDDIDSWVMPKYALTRYSQPHMHELEKAPESCPSAQNLKRSLTMPKNFHGSRPS